MNEVSLVDLPVGTVKRVGSWTVAHNKDGVRAVSSLCRHQFADLSKGSLDAKGCLVCPWHGARYDLDNGKMVQGPRGFLGYVGRTPGYTQFVKAFGSVARLRRAAVSTVGQTLRIGS